MAAKPDWTPVQTLAGHISKLALLVFAYALLAMVAGLRPLPVATALAAAVGFGAALISQMRERPMLAWLWAELTTLVGATFLLSKAGPLWRSGVGGVVDLLLGLLLLLTCIRLYRTTRRCAGAVRPT